MEITIKCETKEAAALVVELQERHRQCFEQINLRRPELTESGRVGYAGRAFQQREAASSFEQHVG